MCLSLFFSSFQTSTLVQQPALQPKLQQPTQQPSLSSCHHQAGPTCHPSPSRTRTELNPAVPCAWSTNQGTPAYKVRRHHREALSHRIPNHSCLALSSEHRRRRCGVHRSRAPPTGFTSPSRARSAGLRLHSAPGVPPPREARRSTAACRIPASTDHPCVQ